MKQIPVKVRNTYATYIAKVIGKPLQASCTAGEEQAIQRLAEKHYGPKATTRPATPQERNSPNAPTHFICLP